MWQSSSPFFGSPFSFVVFLSLWPAAAEGSDAVRDSAVVEVSKGLDELSQQCRAAASLSLAQLGGGDAVLAAQASEAVGIMWGVRMRTLCWKCRAAANRSISTPGPNRFRRS